MKKTHLTILLCLLGLSQAYAQPAEGYYSSIDGKSAVSLKSALYTIVRDKKTLSYDDLFEYYEKVDYIDDKKNSAGQHQVFDYYSAEVYFFTGTGKAPSGMNKEHTVPQSWWSGSTGCKSDLFQVLPSDSKANSAKGNYPLGVITSSVSYSNPRMRTGKGSDNKMVFEPADEYKGDFARIYFYVATCYPDANWQSRSDVNVAMKKENYPTLKAEFQTLLLQWNEQDPVSEWEMTRQERAAKLQGNRNPFIDYPDLANYIWGNKKDTPFDLSTAELHVIPVNPDDPTINPTINPTIDPVNPVDPDINIGTELFHETFADCSSGNNTSNNGQSSSWSGNSQVVSVDKAYQAGGAIKLGSSSGHGGLTTVPIRSDGGNLVVLIAVKGWTSVEGKLIVTLGDQMRYVEYTATMSDAFQTLQVIFTDVVANPVLEIETETKRCFIDDIRVCQYKEATPTSITAPSVLSDFSASSLSSSHSDVIYDLVGRRVTGVLPRGIYIRNGKKILIP